MKRKTPVRRTWRIPGAVALLASLVILLVGYGGALNYLRPPRPGTELPLSQLVTLSLNKQVKSAQFLDEDHEIIGMATFNGATIPQPYWASYSKSDALTNDLLKTFLNSQTVVSFDPQPNKGTIRFVAQFLLPIVILANLFGLLFTASRGGGAGAADFKLFGRIKNRGGAVRRAGFQDVGGAEEAVLEIAEVCEYLKDPTAFAALGALPPKGVLIMGPPGCGKTLLARAAAGEAGVPFFSLSGSQFVEALVGVGAARVRDLFEQLRAAAPAMLFIDELDAVGRRRGAGIGGGHDEREQTLNELLVQMDGFAANDGVVVLAATNRPDILDPALLRPGRFDRQVTMEAPDREGRLSILRLHARNRPLADPSRDLPELAAATAGFTGADLGSLLNEAALLAVRDRAPAIDRRHLDEAMERVLSGPKRKGRLIGEEEKRRRAYHEAGHAVTAVALGKGDRIQKVSIIARGRGLGHLALLQEDKDLYTQSEMEVDIAIALSGLVAEILAFDEPSTGSEQDLERATRVARDIAGRYGMSSELGRMRILKADREVFLGRDYFAAQDASQPTLEQLDKDVRAILRRQEERAESLLQNNRRSLDALAEQLVRDETVEGEGLQQLVAQLSLRVAAHPAQRRRGE
jgi:cell division protease FtsH